MNPPVIFDDPTGIHDTVALLAQDPEVIGVELWRAAADRRTGERLAAQLKQAGELGVVSRWVDACAVERLADRIILRDPIFDQDHRVLKTLWMGTNVSVIKLPPLSVCDLGKTEVRNALNVDMAALMSYDLSVPQRWGLAIQQHPANFRGIKYHSRFNNRPCLALFDRDAQGIPREWIKKIRRAMVTLVPQYNTWRMVQEYATKYYLTK